MQHIQYYKLFDPLSGAVYMMSFVVHSVNIRFGYFWAVGLLDLKHWFSGLSDSSRIQELTWSYNQQ